MKSTHFKNTLLLSVAVFLGTFSFAQKSNIRAADNALDKAVAAKNNKKTDEETENLKKAKEAIDLAVADPSTVDNAKAWYSKANVYFALQGNENFKAQNPYQEGVAALKKAFELDPKLKADTKTTTLLINGAYFSFDDGVGSYNDSKFEAAYKDFSTALDLLGKKPDRRFLLYPSVDTVRAQAKMLSAYAAYYLNKYDEAVALLKEAKEDPYLPEQQPGIYIMLAQAYEKSGDKAAQLAVIEEGRKKYPDDANLNNAELNYYINSGEKDKMIAKLKAAAEKDPDNAELTFNLGMVYDHMAHPKEGTPPANAAEYEQNAIAYYQKTLSLAPDNGTYNYQFGAYYFNRAVEANDKLSEMDLSQKEKYNALLKERDDYFAKALPLLEKSNTIFSAAGKKLSGKEKNFYAQNLQALSKIYAIQNKLDKAKEARDALNALDGQ